MKSLLKHHTNDSIKGLKLAILTSLVILMTFSTSLAAEYYIDGKNGFDGDPGTLSSPWKTIEKANDTLKPGDTVYLRGGTYSGEQISPRNSGTAENRITYQSYKDEIVKIVDVKTAILLNNRSYVTVTGSPTQKLIVANVDHGATANQADHIILSYIDFGVMRKYASSKGIHIGEGSTYCWIHHCDIHEYGYFDGNDHGDMLYIGSSPAEGNAYNLVENNHIYYGGHVPLKVTGKYVVVRNNHLHNEEWYNYNGKSFGNRCMVCNDYEDKTVEGWTLIEGNRFSFTGIPSDAGYADGIQHSNHDCIVRKNMFYSCKGQGFKISANERTQHVDNNYVYNNVFFNNGIGGVSSRYQNAIWLRANYWSINNTVIRNNIFYKNENNLKTNGTVTNTVFENNWESGDPLFIDVLPEKTTDPFDPNYPDFNLQGSSPCIDAGGFLTTTTNAGSGTKIPVKDAHYFIDGWGMEELGVYGDVVQLQGSTQTARIVEVDYARNILTLDKSISWSAGQGISLSYYGSAPDMGAIEYGSEGNTPTVLEAPSNLRVIFQ